MPTANEALRDATLLHEIGLRRLASGTLRKLVRLLAQADAELVDQIRKRLAWIADRGYDASDFTLRRLEANLRELRSVTREAYAALGKELRSDMMDLSVYEAEWNAKTVDGLLLRLGVALGTVSPSRELLRAIVETRPFQGGLLRDWARKLEADAYGRVRQAIRQGLLQGQTIDQIVRRINGTKAQGYADGILEANRRDIATIVRTATAHVTNTARDEFYRNNADLVKAVQWTATLDSRTSDLCMSRDGHTYALDTHRPLDGGPPWEAGPGRLHMNCRSTSVPVLKSWKELGIALPDAPPGLRASMNGQVPASTTFGVWIKGQPASVQDKVLGVSRARALRSGTLSFDRFFDREGHFLTLDELKLREAA